MTRRIFVVVAVLTALCAAEVSAQRIDPQVFEIEWKRRTDPWVKPGLEGWVYNPTGYRVGSMRLRVQQLDDGNQVVKERAVWVYGYVPAKGRANFLIWLEPQDHSNYRISVESFVLISQDAP